MRRGVTLFLSSIAILSACGARTPLIVDESCHGPTIPVSTDLPTLYYVLDHSRSMRDGDKWSQVRTALATVMGKVDTQANFATVIYPTPGGDSCSTGQLVMPPQRGNGVQTVETFLQVTSPDPDGGTPTAATLEDLAIKLVGAKNTYVVLATDGGPNCNANISCDSATCVLNIEGLDGCNLNGPNCCSMSSQNCLDRDEAIKSVKDLKKAGVSTFIVGIPGSEIYSPVLDDMATAGGTALAGSPKYYRVDTPEALAKSLSDIADMIVKSCTLHLDHAPAHPETARVEVRGVWRNPGTDYAISGTKLDLFGSACTDFGGDVTQIHIEDGCVVSVP